jgi:hypothetical protein
MKALPGPAESSTSSKSCRSRSFEDSRFGARRQHGSEIGVSRGVVVHDEDAAGNAGLVTRAETGVVHCVELVARSNVLPPDGLKSSTNEP